MSKPLVSVWCSAYNHEKYIAQAIEGFVMQKTTFEVEIFIHDDASPDNTANIIREYAARYPQIRPILQTENKFSVDKSYLNRIMFEKAKGKYIAMCEGDDYWTDPLKLQKQIDFLEANPDFAICFHRVKIIHEDKSRDLYLSNENQKVDTTFEDLTLANYISTLSCVYRSNLFSEFPDWFLNSPVGDYPLHLLNAQFGKIKFFSEPMATYRIHHNGMWSMQEEEKKLKNWLIVLEYCYQHFYPRGEVNFKKQQAQTLTDLCFVCFREGKYKEYRHYLKSLLRKSLNINPRTFAALIIRFLVSYQKTLADFYKKVSSS